MSAKIKGLIGLRKELCYVVVQLQNLGIRLCNKC